jgi:hypothetical protein
MWEEELRNIPTRRNDLSNRMVQAYSLMWDQCSDVMKSKLEQLAGFQAFDDAKDPIRLLRKIRNIVCGREAHLQDIWSMCQQIKLLITEYQKTNESNKSYFERFHGMWEALRQQGGSLTNHTGLVCDQAQVIAGIGMAVTQAQIDDAQAHEDEEMKAAFMLSGVNLERHKKLKRHLEDSFIMGRNEYPTSTTALLSMMNNFRGVDGRNTIARPAENYKEDGLNFIQEGDLNKGGYLDEIKLGVSMLMRKKGEARVHDEKHEEACMHCGGEHSLAECPHITNEQLDEVLIQLKAREQEARGSMFCQEEEKLVLKRNYLYLDTCTTKNQLIAPKYLKGIHKA